MAIQIQPLLVLNLKDACIKKLEDLILSGEFQIGERLPPERHLAVRLGISRPVVHEALVDLASKGLVDIQPRRGVFVSDFRTHGSVTILASLLDYSNGDLDPAMRQSLFDMRVLLETETARLAAINHNSTHLSDFQALLEQEKMVDHGDAQSLTRLDFNFHLLVALASGNLVYPLIINSFKGVYTGLTQAFFDKFSGCAVVKQVHNYHIILVEKIQAMDEKSSAEIMREMLIHGERHLKGE